MPVNKNAMIRYQALDRCFSKSGPGLPFSELLQACNDALLEHNGHEGVSRRQLYADIAYMESDQGWAIELEKTKKERTVLYRYADPEFSINKRPMSPEEAQQLREAIFTLSRFKGMPQFEWVDELSARLEASFDLKHGAGQVIEFEENPYLKGKDYITPLFHAILNRQVLKVTYQGFRQQKAEEIRFHPYFLKQYNNRWFIFGRHEEGISS